MACTGVVALMRTPRRSPINAIAWQHALQWTLSWEVRAQLQLGDCHPEAPSPSAAAHLLSTATSARMSST